MIREESAQEVYMTPNDHGKIYDFRTQVQAKIEKLLAEFAAGAVSREQFHALYAHHTTNLQLAEQALEAKDTSLIDSAQGATISIRQAHMGKAIGLMIYHNKTGMFVETLGAFDVPPALISPILNDFSMLMEADRAIDRRVEKVGERQWLLFAAGRYTTVITLFHNEPSAQQSREIERLHHDFEVANANMLSGIRLDASKLAYPFTVFVQQKLTPKR